MVLRRVTLSGRFNPPREEEQNEKRSVHMTWARGLLFMALDIVLALAVAISLFYLFVKKVVSPSVHGFYCSDTSITKPFLPNTITTPHLLLVTMFAPAVLICLLEAIIHWEAKGNDRPTKFLNTSTVVYLEYVVSYALCTFAMEFFKCYVGRLRPHFLTACQPDWTKMDCKTDPNAFINGEDVACLADPHRVRVIRTSFPSGHTMAAWFMWFFFFFHIRRLLKAVDSQRLRKASTVMMVVMTVWCTVCAVTRVTDNWHHPTDVLGGLILALVFTVYAAFRNSDTVYSERQIEPVKEKEQ